MHEKKKTCLIFVNYNEPKLRFVLENKKKSFVFLGIGKIMWQASFSCLYLSLAKCMSSLMCTHLRGCLQGILPHNNVAVLVARLASSQTSWVSVLRFG